MTTAARVGARVVLTNLAVGVLGDSGDPANSMYIGVPAIGVIGAIIVRLRPHEMARALFAAALAQALVAVIVLIFRLGSGSLPGVLGILIFNGFFVSLFIGSACCFGMPGGSELPPAQGSRVDLPLLSSQSVIVVPIHRSA